MSGSPAMASSVGIQSRCATISLQIEPAGSCPASEPSAGTRKAPSQFVFFSERNGVVPASGHELQCGPLSVLYITIVLSAIPILSSNLSIFADHAVVIHHRVVIFATASAPPGPCFRASRACGSACAWC